jgi:3' exoribonuclease, RNase T-like
MACRESNINVSKGHIMRNLMVDLETLSTRSNAALVSIGAVMFDHTGQGATFYHAIKRDGQEDMGLHVDQQTLAWWAKQSPQARAALSDPKAVSIQFAMLEFVNFYRANGANRIWSHGSSFDTPILRNAMRACSIKDPSQYWNDRCTRTLYAAALINEKSYRDASAHNALADAIAQAKAATAAMLVINKVRDLP